MLLYCPAALQVGLELGVSSSVPTTELGDLQEVRTMSLHVSGLAAGLTLS